MFFEEQIAKPADLAVFLIIKFNYFLNYKTFSFDEKFKKEDIGGSQKCNYEKYYATCSLSLPFSYFILKPPTSMLRA